MGRIALVLVFIVMIVVGTVSVALHERQHRSVDKIVETTQVKQAKHFASSYAKQAIPELMEMVVANNGIEGIGPFLNTYNNRPPVSINSNLTDATYKTTISQGEFQGHPIANNEFAITTIVTFTGDDGETYELGTHILFESKASGVSEPPTPFTPPDPATVGVSQSAQRSRLNLILRTNQVRLGYPQANNDNNDLFQHYPGQHTVWDDASEEKLEVHGFSYIIPQNQPPTGGVDIRAANHNGNSANPENPTYPLKFYLPRRNNGTPVRTFRIDGHLFAKDKKRENLALYIDGNVYLQANLSSRQIYANIYYTGDLVRPNSVHQNSGVNFTNANLGTTSVNFQGGTLWTSTNKEIFTRKVSQKEFEDLWEQRHEDILPEDVCPICFHYNCNCTSCVAGSCTSCGGSSTSGWTPTFKTLIEEPVRRLNN